MLIFRGLDREIDDRQTNHSRIRAVYEDYCEHFVPKKGV